MIKFSHKGSFKNLEKLLHGFKDVDVYGKLHKYGKMGVSALSSVTPVETGVTSNSWYYEIRNEKDGSFTLSFCNSNIVKNVNIAIILQYGHGTGTGGYVSGRDYINPAIQPVFDKMANELGELE